MHFSNVLFENIIDKSPIFPMSHTYIIYYFIILFRLKVTSTVTVKSLILNLADSFSLYVVKKLQHF